MEKNKYCFIVYNCGYQLGFRKTGPVTGKSYPFKKKCVTKVDERDGKEFCKMTSNDIQWCDKCDRDIPPFMTAEDWCNCKPGTYTIKGGHKYDVKKYIELMSVETVMDKIRKGFIKMAACCKG